MGNFVRSNSNNRLVNSLNYEIYEKYWNHVQSVAIFHFLALLTQQKSGEKWRIFSNWYSNEISNLDSRDIDISLFCRFAMLKMRKILSEIILFFIKKEGEWRGKRTLTSHVKAFISEGNISRYSGGWNEKNFFRVQTVKVELLMSCDVWWCSIHDEWKMKKTRKFHFFSLDHSIFFWVLWKSKLE